MKVAELDAPDIWQNAFDGPLVEWYICDNSEYYVEMNTETDAKWYIVDRRKGQYYAQLADPPVVAGPFDSLSEAKAVYITLVRLGGYLQL